MSVFTFGPSLRSLASAHGAADARIRALVGAPGLRGSIAAGAELEGHAVAAGRHEAQVHEPYAGRALRRAGERRHIGEPAEEAEHRRIPRLSSDLVVRRMPIAGLRDPGCLVHREVRRIETRDEAV